jgi:chromosome transmission fidelity protein 1
MTRTDWLEEHFQRSQREERLRRVRELQSKIQKQQKRLRQLLELEDAAPTAKRPRAGTSPPPPPFPLLREDPYADAEADESRFLPRDCDSDEEAAGTVEAATAWSSSDEEEEQEESVRAVQVIYASRTHSQLAQFLGEVRRTRLGRESRVLVLGARRALCIHPRVRRLPSAARVNDACLDLVQRRKAAARPGCPHLALPGQRLLRDLILARPRDLEELLELGEAHQACPYYASRRALPRADLVLVPYSSLLHGPTRDSLGLQLRGNVLILDEAHNLPEAIADLHCVRLSPARLTLALQQLSTYEERYRLRLRPRNLMYLQQLISIVRALLRLARPQTRSQPRSQQQQQQQQQPEQQQMPQPQEAYQSRLLRINEFLFEAGFDNVNLFKLLRYLRRSELARKVQGFVEHLEAHEPQVEVRARGQDQLLPEEGEQMDATEQQYEEQRARAALGQVVAFLEALCGPERDGRILLGEEGLRFLLLHPELRFQELLQQARAVVLVGGTLSPFSDLTARLMPRLPPARLRVCSYQRALYSALLGFSRAI